VESRGGSDHEQAGAALAHGVHRGAGFRTSVRASTENLVALSRIRDRRLGEENARAPIGDSADGSTAEDQGGPRFVQEPFS